MAGGILHGLKVADFTMAIAGPLVTRYLSAEGATVVKVECHKYPDPVRSVIPYKDDIPGIDRSAQFAFYNHSKYGISLDIARPLGLDVARRLVAWADVVIENMRPGSMKRLSLDYESCRRIRPDTIYLSSSSLGRTGPLAEYAAWGYHHGPLAGLSELTGWPDRLPCADSIAYTDTTSPSFSVIALVGALLHRRRTGEGAYIDQSQMEAGLYFLGPTIMGTLLNGRPPTRQGNRDPQMAPHGVYPCRGEDKWAAIAVADDEEWQAFREALGATEWTSSTRFASLPARKRNEDELDALVGAWTVSRTAGEVTNLLQSAGVRAGPVNTAEELFNDPQLKHRGHFAELEHEVIGRHSYELPSFRFSKVPPQPQRPAPLLGQDNEYVLKEILGLSEEEIADLFVEGAITTDADLPVEL